jgi:hypothetical protein
MNLIPDPLWKEVPPEIFNAVMDELDYVRDGWADGIVYKGQSPFDKRRLGALMNDGRCLLHKNLIPK